MVVSVVSDAVVVAVAARVAVVVAPGCASGLAESVRPKVGVAVVVGAAVAGALCSIDAVVTSCTRSNQQYIIVIQHVRGKKQTYRGVGWEQQWKW